MSRRRVHEEDDGYGERYLKLSPLS